MIYQRIRYFIRAAECGSFSGAAAEMYVTSQALTRQIGLLEEEVGGKLFFRSARGVTLTPLGEYAYSRFVRLDGQLQDTFQELKRRAGTERGQIRIGVFSALPRETLVTPLISFLLGTHADCSFQLEMSGLDEGRQRMLRDQLDLLITNTHQEDAWPGCRVFSFGTYSTQVVVSLLHPWTLKEQITAEDLKNETFLKMDMHTGTYKVPAEQSFYENIPCRSIRRVSNFDTLLALLQQGEGFAVFPRAYAYMEQAHMKYFDYPGQAPVFHTALICRSDTDNDILRKLQEDLRSEYDLTEIEV